MFYSSTLSKCGKLDVDLNLAKRSLIVQLYNYYVAWVELLRYLFNIFKSRLHLARFSRPPKLIQTWRWPTLSKTNYYDL